MGKYQCRAQNKLGSSEGTIEVIRQFEPNCVVGLCEGFAAAAAAAAAWHAALDVLVAAALLLLLLV